MANLRLIYAKQDLMMRLVINLERRIRIMTVEMDKLIEEVAENTTVIESALVAIAGFKEALDAAGTDPVKLAELSASLAVNNDKLATAIATNTPAERK